MKRTRKHKRWRKVAQAGTFSVFQDAQDEQRFETSWRKPEGGYGRRRFRAESIEAAIAEAPTVAGFYATSGQDGPDKSVLEAFEETLGQTRRAERAVKHWRRYQVRFMEWFVSHYPDCQTWAQLTRAMVRGYIRENFAGRAANTIRLAVQPLTQTGGYMAREYQIPNVTERLGIGNKLAKTPPMVHLADVLDFLKWFAEKEPRLAAGVALQGLVGLQMQEALRLTWDKVDLERGWIEISGEVKNAYRVRVLPVCDVALDHLRRAARFRTGEPVEDIKAPVVPSPTGCSYADGYNSWINYSRVVRQRLKEWNPGIDWTTKVLRNCLPTFAIINGLHNDVWEQNIGHVPRSVTAQHYLPQLATVSRGQEQALARQMAILRMQVVNLLNRAIENGGEAHILNAFELKPATAGKNPSGKTGSRLISMG